MSSFTAAATALKNEVIGLKSQGNSKATIVSAIQADSRFYSWANKESLVGIIYDFLDGVAHGILAESYSIHSKLGETALTLLTGGTDFSSFALTGSGDFQVNLASTSSDVNPAVAGLTSGGFVVTWIITSPGSAKGVFGQIYDVNGDKFGSEFQVDTDSSGTQGLPSAVGLPGGGFVIIWESTTGDGSGDAVYGRFYNSNYAALSGQFLVNTETSNEQRYAGIDSLAFGGFVIVWSSNNQDTSGRGIFGQVYDEDGATVGSEFQIYAPDGLDQVNAKVAGTLDGGFVVVWESEEDEDGDGSGIFARAYDSDYVAVGTAFQVNTFSVGDQQYPSITCLKSGEIVIVWQSEAQDGSGFGVYGQVFNTSYSKVNSEFRLNTVTSGDQIMPRVSSLTFGGYSAVWEDELQDGAHGIYGQLYDHIHNKLGSEFHANVATGSNHVTPAVANLTTGGFAVTWSDIGVLFAFEIHGQIYDLFDNT